jgi:hypothetical protein
MRRGASQSGLRWFCKLGLDGAVSILLAFAFEMVDRFQVLTGTR